LFKSHQHKVVCNCGAKIRKKTDIIFETNNITTNKVIYKLHQMLVKIKFANFTA